MLPALLLLVELEGIEPSSCQLSNNYVYVVVLFIELNQYENYIQTFCDCKLFNGVL